MTERWHWRDAEEMAQWLCIREEERGILLFLARLPFVSQRVLGQLTGVSKTSVYRSLTLLRERDLIAAIKPPVPAGRSPELVYLTDLALATIAIDRDIDLDHLVRRLHLRGKDLVALLPQLAQLTSLYELLGALAASRAGRPRILAWERPWRRHYCRPTAQAPVCVSLPAYSALFWDDGHGAYFLVGSYIPILMQVTVRHHPGSARKAGHEHAPRSAPRRPPRARARVRSLYLAFGRRGPRDRRRAARGCRCRPAARAARRDRAQCVRIGGQQSRHR